MVEKLSCGHPKECYYFHPSLKGGLRHRCCACDDPEGRTRAVQELVKKGILWRGKPIGDGTRLEAERG